MNKRPAAISVTAIAARASGGYANGGQMGKKASNANHVSLRAQNRDSEGRPGPGFVMAQSHEPKEPPLSTVSTSNVPPRSHQRRWSVDYCRRVTSPVITVKKTKKQPQPPQRSVSLLRPNPASHPYSKRFSCPPIGSLTSPGQSPSSSSSSATSSCSSPPPVPTSVITGHDPLGWKLRPKSHSTSARTRTNRLSLQIPLPAVPAPSPDPKPALKPKPSRRHSDSSAFLPSLANPLPVVTIEELCAMHFRPFKLSDDSEDVFSEGAPEEEEERAAAHPSKIPPPVAGKTAMTRQMAQLITCSRQRCGPVAAKDNDKNIYTSVMKPKPQCSRQTVDRSGMGAIKTSNKYLDVRRDRGRSTPHFPG
ncbi:mediator of DNA damage checkpoint protein 1-like [Brachyistius frenatus]|uniref:mediator of DNA damage checkpoint protein 1-like n=1 Tax=Brachyistius frenatus TaxID=100188 RepID=UPI0037E7FAFF